MLRNRLRNLVVGHEIATPRQVGARNDKRERAEDGISGAIQRLREATE